MGIYSGDSDLIKALKLLQGGVNTYAGIKDVQAYNEQQRLDEARRIQKEKDAQAAADAKARADQIKAMREQENTDIDNAAPVLKDLSERIRGGVDPGEQAILRSELQAAEQSFGHLPTFSEFLRPKNFSKWMGDTEAIGLGVSSQVDTMRKFYNGADAAGTPNATTPPSVSSQETGGGPNTLATFLRHASDADKFGEAYSKALKQKAEAIPDYRIAGYTNEEEWEKKEWEPRVINELVDSFIPEGMSAADVYRDPKFFTNVSNSIMEMGVRLGLSPDDPKMKALLDHHKGLYESKRTADQAEAAKIGQENDAVNALVKMGNYEIAMRYGGRVSDDGMMVMDLDGTGKQQQANEYKEYWMAGIRALQAQGLVPGETLDVVTLSQWVTNQLRDRNAGVSVANEQYPQGKLPGQSYLSDAQAELMNKWQAKPGAEYAYDPDTRQVIYASRLGGQNAEIHRIDEDEAKRQLGLYDKFEKWVNTPQTEKKLSERQAKQQATVAAASRPAAEELAAMQQQVQAEMPEKPEGLYGTKPRGNEAALAAASQAGGEIGTKLRDLLGLENTTLQYDALGGMRNTAGVMDKLGLSEENEGVGLMSLLMGNSSPKAGLAAFLANKALGSRTAPKIDREQKAPPMTEEENKRLHLEQYTDPMAYGTGFGGMIFDGQVSSRGSSR